MTKNQLRQNIFMEPYFIQDLVCISSKINNKSDRMIQFLPIKQILSLALISVLTGLSQTAGIGGGPIINLCLMLNYESKISISLTYVFLIGGSLASLWKNASKINEKTGLSYVSQDLILVTLPMISAGALLGIMGKNYLSELWVTILFIIIFIYLFMEILRNFRKIRNKPAKQLPPTSERKFQLSNPAIEQPASQLSEKNSEIISLNKNQANSKKSKKPLAVFLLAGIYYAGTVLFSVAKGGVGQQPLLPINPCGFANLIIVALHIGMSYAVSLGVIKRLLRSREQDKTQQANEFKIENTHDIPINEENKKYLMGAGFGAGVLGATLAIGGAPILIPMWLRAGIDHNVAASTTPALILTSSMISFTISAMNGAYSQTSVSKLILFLAVSFTSSAIIKDLFTYLAEKYRLKTLVLVLLMIVILISLLVLVPYQLIKMLHNFEQFASFGVFC